MSATPSSVADIGRDLRRAEPTLLWVRAGQSRHGPPPDLQACGWRLSEAKDAGEALRESSRSPADVCVVDLTDGRSALTAARLLRARQPALPIIGLVEANAAAVSEALVAGVADLLPWPAPVDDVLRSVTAARERAGRPVPRGALAEAPIFAVSPAMRSAVAELAELAASSRPVCLVGEPGSGRRRLARELHGLVGGADAPFVVADVAGKSPAEFERVLFGTDGPADGSQPERLAATALIVSAIGGTLFIPNLGDVAVRLQARLVRLLRDGEAEIDGARVPADIRLVVSLAAGPDEAVGEGRLRRDLADRLAVVHVPPLRLRAADVPLLADGLLHQARRHPMRTPAAFSRAAATLLAALPWPGNVRELKALVENLAAGDMVVIGLEDVLAHVRLGGDADQVDLHLPLHEARQQFERQYIAAALARHRGRMTEAARALGIQRTNLYRKLRQLGLNRAGQPPAG